MTRLLEGVYAEGELNRLVVDEVRAVSGRYEKLS